MKLYSNSLSPNAKRARVAANELGIKLDIQEMDFAKGDNRSPDYVQKYNPMGKIPTLVDDDGYTLWESGAILVYLAAKHPEKGFIGTDPRTRAEVARWMLWNASHFERATNTIAYEKVIKPMFYKQATDEARVAEGMKEWERFAPVLNGQLEGKQWVTGDKMTIADIALGTTIEFSTTCGCDYARYPHIKSWLGRLQARDAWKKA